MQARLQGCGPVRQGFWDSKARGRVGCPGGIVPSGSLGIGKGSSLLSLSPQPTPSGDPMLFLLLWVPKQQ